MASIRVALAEDNALLREGISRIIDGEEDLELVGQAADLPELLALIETESPQVVVTDIRMPPTGTDEGIQAASWLREHMPEVGVVVLSQYKTPSYALALLETGSAGRAYLLKEQVAGADELAQAIRTVAQGGSVIDPQIVDELIEAKSSRRKSDLPGSRRASPRSWRRWPRARATPPSPPPCRSRNGQWRSTPTPSSRSWA